MRILANFTKKVSTAQYENEQYMVTIEAESEFNNIDQIADYLFHQARAAVERQIAGTANTSSPTTTIPSTPAAPEPEAKQPAPKSPEKPSPASNGNGNGNGNGTNLPPTEKQLEMIRKLLNATFTSKQDAQRWMQQQTGVTKMSDLTRKVASRAIEALVERKRNAA